MALIRPVCGKQWRAHNAPLLHLAQTSTDPNTWSSTGQGLLYCWKWIFQMAEIQWFNENFIISVAPNPWATPRTGHFCEAVHITLSLSPTSTSHTKGLRKMGMGLWNGAPLVLQQSSPSWPFYPDPVPEKSRKETKSSSAPKKKKRVWVGGSMPQRGKEKRKENGREEARHLSNLENISQYQFRCHCPWKLMWPLVRLADTTYEVK